MAKATNAQTTRRVTAIYKLILLGADRESIMQYVTKEGWDVETRMIDDYAARARKLLIELTKTDRENQLALARARLNLLFAKTVALNDYKTALAIQKDINALEGLYAPAITENRMSGAVGIKNVDDMTDEELARFIQQPRA